MATDRISFPGATEHAISTQAKLDCLVRAKASLRDTVKDLEQVIGSEETLIVLAGAMRSISAIDRLAQSIALEAGQ